MAVICPYAPRRCVDCPHCRFDNDIFVEYVYIFGLDDQWRCFAYDHLDRMAKLGAVLENEDILYPEDEEEEGEES